MSSPARSRSSTPPPPAGKPRWRRIVRRVLFLGAVALLGVHLVSAVALLALKWVDPPSTALQIQRRIEAMVDDRTLVHRRTAVPLERISPHLQHAVVAAEDGRFFDHGGIDWDELDKVVQERLSRTGNRRGASTITQQLVKNLFFGTRVRWVGKGFELTLAPLADALLSKQRILELYLNNVEWGDGLYGIQSAAHQYYGISAAELDRDQAARLAACLPSPRRRRPQRMDRYSAIILQRMSAHGW